MKKVIRNKVNVNDKILDKDEMVDTIPDKDEMIDTMNKGYMSVEVNDASKIVEIIKERKVSVDSTCDELCCLFLELIRRVFNAMIGDNVRSYRQKTLMRVITATFRIEIAVKSEKKK